MGDNELNQQVNELTMDFRGTLSPSENKGILAGRGQHTRQLNGLVSIGTPSLVTRCVVQMI